MDYSASTFFDVSQFPYKDIFDGVENVWDVLSRIASYAKGKPIMGKNCQIADSARMREGVILGDNVKIGHSVELKNCIILNDSTIAHLNYVADSVVGNNVNISAGAVCANFRLDKQNVHVKQGANTIDTGLRKFSAIIGDGTMVGCNCVLNPGTCIGKNSIVYPLVSVTGTHPDNSIIKQKIRIEVRKKD